MTQVVQSSDHRQLLLAASLMADPSLVNAVFPPSSSGTDLGIIDNPVARAAVSLLSTYGPAYANPGAMSAAIADLGGEFDGNDVVALSTLMPAPFDIELQSLLELKESIAEAHRVQSLARTYASAGHSLRSGADPHEVNASVQRAAREFSQAANGKDASSAGIADRMKKKEQATTRWKIAHGVPGGEFVDGQVKGIDKDGNFSDGLAGSGEMIVVTAGSGVGKTRLTINWVRALLDQGASCSLLVLEDSESRYLVKIAAQQFGLEMWHIEFFLADEAKYRAQFGHLGKAETVEAAITWMYSLKDRLRIYDRATKQNIFKFASAAALIEEDIYLNGTHFWMIDYVNVWKGELQQLEGYTQDLLALAGRHNVGIIALSQVSKETQKFGITPGMIPTKSSSDWGHAAHFGYYLEVDPQHGQKEMKITQVKGRDAGMTEFYAHFEVLSGRIRDYAGSPMLMGIEAPSAEGGKKTPPKKGGRA